MLENYIGGVKKDLGYQSETSLVLGIDYYHYDENWWIHNGVIGYHYIMDILNILIIIYPLPNSFRRR